MASGSAASLNDSENYMNILKKKITDITKSSKISYHIDSDADVYQVSAIFGHGKIRKIVHNAQRAVLDSKILPGNSINTHSAI